MLKFTRNQFKLTFGAYCTLGSIQKLIVNGFRRRGPYEQKFPDYVSNLANAVMEEIHNTAIFLGQNEYATIGGNRNTLKYIYSTGFFCCLGLVLVNLTSNIVTLAHVAPLTGAEMSVNRMVDDFVNAGGNINSSSTELIIFGGRESEELTDKLKQINLALPNGINSRRITLAELGVDNGWGFYFDRINGSYGAIRGYPLTYTANFQGCEFLSIMSTQRRCNNTRNDSLRDSSELLLVTRDI